MGGFKLDWMVSRKYRTVICALPLWVRIGNSDFSRMRTVTVQILILRLSYSWVKTHHISNVPVKRNVGQSWLPKFPPENR